MAPATDKLCRSYLDLRWHLDPAAGSAASAGEHDTRLGQFDVESIGEHLAAFRSLAKAVEDMEVTDLQDEIDRTALLEGRRQERHLSEAREVGTERLRRPRAALHQTSGCARRAGAPHLSNLGLVQAEGKLQ